MHAIDELVRSEHCKQQAVSSTPSAQQEQPEETQSCSRRLSDINERKTVAVTDLRKQEQAVRIYTFLDVRCDDTVADQTLFTMPLLL